MHRRILRPTLLPTLAAVAIASAFLQGYTTTGHKWSTTSVPYYINPQSVYVSASAAISAVQTGAAVWSEQSRANIRLVYSGTTNGSSLVMNNKNEVFFRNGSNGSSVAETYWWWDASGRLVDADTVMYEGGYQFFTVAGCTGGIYVENVMAHEFGHALGLNHSSVPGATMQASMPSYCDRTQLTLEADDISGIESLYPPTGGPPPPSNTPPTVSIGSPANNSSFASGTSITFSGAASDPQDGNITSSLRWTSNLLGQIGTGGTFTSALSAGTHLITATAIDSGGLSGFAQVTTTVTVAPPVNTAPTVTISTPANNSSYPSGASITFSATATDAQDGNISGSVRWTSNLVGQIGIGGSLTSALAAGTHLITATAIDSGGLSGFAQVTTTVTVAAPPVNAPPVITILTPLAAGSYAAGTPITFSGTAIDVPEGDISNRLFWTSSISGVLGGGAQFTASLPAGTHLITAQAGDNSGLSSNKQVTIVVASNQPPPPPPPPPADGVPVITITSPVSTGSYADGTPITFSGTAMDNPEGDISNRLFWTSSISGVLNAGASFTMALPAGTHVITAQAGDNSGFSSFRQVTIVVGAAGQTPPPPANTAPVVTVSSPLNGSSYVETANITFSGSAIDTQEGDISARLVWTSNVSGVLGTGAGFTRTLAPGAHLITVSAGDNGGLSSFAQVTVTVTSSQQPSPPASAPISLSVRGYKVTGNQRADLTWSGATGSFVDVYRNGARIATPANTSSWTDAINRKGSGSYTYRVCNSGTSTCSSDVTITF